MDAPSHVFNVIENIIPDLDQWNFRFENSNSAQIFSWLKEEDRGEDPKLFTSWIKEEDQPIVPGQQPIVNSSDLDVFNEFFPSVSPHSTSSSSSASSNSFEGVSPPAFYPQNLAPQWSNAHPVYHHSYQPYVAPYNSQVSLSSQNIRTRAGKAVEECSNCRTKQSTMWRWNTKTGERECNACNLYEAHNNRKRPLELWKDKILKRRKRNPRQIANN